MPKKFIYMAPETEAFTLQMEGTLCGSIDLSATNNVFMFGSLTETDATFAGEWELF